MNKVILSGNLVRVPELRRTPNGTSVCESTIAVNRERKDANGEYSADFIPFVCWQQQAEYLVRNGRKGDRVELVGRWQQREYTDRDGNRRRADEVQVENISVFSRQQETPSTAPSAAAPSTAPSVPKPAAVPAQSGGVCKTTLPPTFEDFPDDGALPF